MLFWLLRALCNIRDDSVWNDLPQVSYLDVRLGSRLVWVAWRMLSVLAVIRWRASLRRGSIGEDGLNELQRVRYSRQVLLWAERERKKRVSAFISLQSLKALRLCPWTSLVSPETSFLHPSPVSLCLLLYTTPYCRISLSISAFLLSHYLFLSAFSISPIRNYFPFLQGSGAPQEKWKRVKKMWVK